MFNLDLFESLETDLNSYLKQDGIMGTLSVEEKNLMNSERERDAAIQRYEQVLNEYNSIDLKIENTIAHLNEQKRQFDVHGGLVKERRDSFILEINSIENQRFLTMEKNRNSFKVYFPLYW